jgi:hypothetical protein
MAMSPHGQPIGQLSILKRFKELYYRAYHVIRFYSIAYRIIVNPCCFY